MKVKLEKENWKKVEELYYGDVFLSKGEAWLVTNGGQVSDNYTVCVKLETGELAKFRDTEIVEYVSDAEVVYD